MAKRVTIQTKTYWVRLRPEHAKKLTQKARANDMSRAMFMSRILREEAEK